MKKVKSVSLLNLTNKSTVWFSIYFLVSEYLKEKDFKITKLHSERAMNPSRYFQGNATLNFKVMFYISLSY
jgi:hypothetical protein